MREATTTTASDCLAMAPEAGISTAREPAISDTHDVHQSDSDRREREAKAPLFSIVLMTYNRPEFLKGALQSLQDQTMQDFEVVLVNDCGTPVEDILVSFDLDITYIRRGQNGGPSAATNTALNLCRGRFIGYLGDDDIVLPEHLAIHARTHAEHPDSVVYTDARCLTIAGRGMPSIVTDWPSEAGFSKEKLFVRNFIMANNWTHPRAMLAEIGRFDETLPALVDWDVLLRLASRFPFVHVSERTAEVRFHGGSTGRLTARRAKDYPRLYREVYARYGDFGSEAVREGRQRLLKQLDAGVAEQPPVEDYQSLFAKLRLDETSDAFKQRVAALAAATSACVVVIDSDGDAQAVEKTLRSVREQCLTPVHTVVSSQLAGSDDAAGDSSAALNAAIGHSGAAWAVCIPAGDTLHRYALLLLAERFANHADMTCCYVDEDNTASGVHDGPIFKPDLNLDLLRSYPYVGACLAIRTRAFVELGGMRRDFKALAHVDLLFRCLEHYGMQNIGHVAEVLHHAATPYPQWLSSAAVAAESPRVVDAHLQRLGIAHEVHSGGAAGVNRIEYRYPSTPLVSIVIPAGDSLPGLNGLIDSMLAKTRYKNHELLIVDTDSQDPAVRAYLDGIESLHKPQLRVLHQPQGSSHSTLCNFAASQARGEYLILLKADMAVLQEDWIEALLNHAQRPEVGVVGAKLHLRDGRIQHAGMVLGLRGPADHPLVGVAADAPGYMQRLQVDQNYSAVTVACLMVRTAVYKEVGGLDEAQFIASYNSVDLCLKVREAGYLTVWTPHVRLMRDVGARGESDTAELKAKLEQIRDDQQAMYRKWLPALANDPAYNRNLGLTGAGFDLDVTRHLAWRPFEQPLLPRMFCIAADETGCGHYRIRQPFMAMQHEGLAEGLLATSHLTPVSLERFAPDGIVLQRQITDGQLAAMRNYKALSRAFKVYELDDYLPNLPVKSAHRGQLPKDILKSLRRALALTDRFVVSTEPLAEQFAGLHDDIRVVLNRLPVNWWGTLPPNQRRVAAKPRLGWAGGASHRGDLELIVDVVRDLADEVEWVFFGMCPDKLRPYVHEVHDGVPIDKYPVALAALNLDLAVAPVEDNTFNACKSNLRLLEYGACGFPVICSDLVCYRGDLPVTRVRNRFKDWVDAIRMHIADLDATAKAGDALRDIVRRDWMLTGDNLVAWCNAWLPDR